MLIIIYSFHDSKLNSLFCNLIYNHVCNLLVFSADEISKPSTPPQDPKMCLTDLYRYNLLQGFYRNPFNLLAMSRSNASSFWNDPRMYHYLYAKGLANMGLQNGPVNNVNAMNMNFGLNMGMNIDIRIGIGISENNESNLRNGPKRKLGLCQRQRHRPSKPKLNGPGQISRAKWEGKIGI